MMVMYVLCGEMGYVRGEIGYVRGEIGYLQKYKNQHNLLSSGGLMVQCTVDGCINLLKIGSLMYIMYVVQSMGAPKC